MSGIYSVPERRLEPPDPVVVGTCHHCSDYIEKGDDIVTLDGMTYHRDCFADCAADILLNHYGALAGVAEKGDGYGG